MKKLLCLTVALLLVFALFAGCGGNDTEETPAPTQAATDTPDESATPTEAAGYDFSDATEVNLTFAIYLADADNTTKDCVHYLDMLKEATEGTVDYTLYAGGTLAPADQELDAVRQGLADVAFFPVGYGSGNMVESYMLEYPGVAFENGKAASYTVQDWFNQVQPEEISDLKLLFALGQGNGCIMTTFPVEKFEDFAGKQIRAGASQAPIIEAYGATPTVMVFSEVYEGLRTGVVQGFYGLAHAGNSIKLYEVTKYAVKDPYYFGTYIMVMNQDVWASLTDDQQAAITDTTAVAFDEFLAAGRDADAQAAYDNFEANGVTVVEFDQANLDKMIGASGYLQEDYAANLDTQGFDGTGNLALFKELAEKYNAEYAE
jgi:TRAP-type C4-dicarboxylate transport system substrate-binding protein